MNVHPAKTEVRFRYPRDLNELVRHAIGKALGDSPAGPSFRAPTWTARETSLGPNPFGAPPDMSLEGVTGHRSPLLPASTESGFEAPASLPFAAGGAEAAGERFFSSLNPVGQLLGTFLVCEGAGEMVLIDQHAADERIVFSRLKDRYLGRSAPIQRWLHPEEVELPGVLADEKSAVEGFLTRAGFTFESRGPGRILLTGGPAALSRFDAGRWWDDFLESVRAQETVPKDIFDADRELWRMACHASVRGGDRVTPDRARLLLAELDEAVAAHSCPHGRPVWFRLTRSQLDAMFRRSG